VEEKEETMYISISFSFELRFSLKLLNLKTWLFNLTSNLMTK